MDKEELEKTLNYVNSHQSNGGSFGVQNNEETSNIKEKIENSKKQNLNNNMANRKNEVSPSNNPSDLDDTSNKLTDKVKDKDKKINPKEMGKNALKKTGRSITNKMASSEDDTTRVMGKGINAVNKGIDAIKNVPQNISKIKKIAKAILVFMKTPLGWGVALFIGIIALIIIISTIFHTIISSLGLKFGLDSSSTYEAYNEAWEEEMKREEVDDIISGEMCGTDKDGKSAIGLWAKFRIAVFNKYNLDNPEELCLFVKKSVEEWEKTTGWSGIYSPGYPVSALFYAYDSQNYNDKGEPSIKVETEEVEKKKKNEEDEEINTNETISTNDLDAISALIQSSIYSRKNVSRVLMNKSDNAKGRITTTNYEGAKESIPSDEETNEGENTEDYKGKANENKNKGAVLDNYVEHFEHPYYKASLVCVDAEGKVVPEAMAVSCSIKCSEEKENKFFTSDTKLDLFLRFGQTVALKYQEEEDKNNAFDKTSMECRVDYEKSLLCQKYNNAGCGNKLDFDYKYDLSKYNVKANWETEEDDNAKITLDEGKTYGYNNGFIYKTYPRYNIDNDEKYTEENGYKIDKDIEYYVETIKARQDYVNYILGYPNNVINKINSTSANCEYKVDGKTYSNLKVRLLYTKDTEVNSAIPNIEAATPIANQELIDFEDYIIGVVYAEAGENSEEVYKTYAVMARTVALSVGKIKEEDGIQILEIAASNGNQHYCNPDKGCIICEGDNGVETSITKGIEVPGAICRSWKDPISEKYSYIKTAVKDVLGVYLTNDDESVKYIEYHMDDYKKIKEMSDNGSDYVEILNSLYSDFNINESTCIVHLSGNLSDSEKSEILSKILEQYPNLSSSRQIAVKTGLDSVGLPYFWGGGHGSIENLLDIVQNKWGVEYCTVTASGSEKQTVGSSYLCGLDCYGFVRWTVYSATSSDPGSGFPSARINYRTSSNLLPGDWAYTDTHVLMFLYKDENGNNVYVHAHGADDGVIVSVYGSSVSYGAPIQFGS